MEWDLTKIKEYIDIIITIASVITIVLGYKVLVYDAKKKQAEVRTESSAAEKLESESDVARLEAVNVLITSSKELILIYKDIIAKLEETIKFQEKERVETQETKLKLVTKVDELIENKRLCVMEIAKIKNELADTKAKLASLESIVKTGDLK